MHMLSVLVEHEAGVLTQVAGVFTRRGFNIESVTVGACENPALARITLRVDTDAEGAERLRRHLERLVTVIAAEVLPVENTVSRELALIKVRADGAQRAEIAQVVEVFRAHIVDLGSSSVVVEVTGDAGKIAAILKVLSDYGVLEVVRTGEAALRRGDERQARGTAAQSAQAAMD